MRTVSGLGARGGRLLRRTRAGSSFPGPPAQQERGRDRPRGKARASACCLRDSGDAGRGLPSGLHQPSGSRAGCKRRSPLAFPWAGRCSAPRRCRSGDVQHGGRSRTSAVLLDPSPAERRAQGPLVLSAAPIPAAQGFGPRLFPRCARVPGAARQPVRPGCKARRETEIQKRAAGGLGACCAPCCRGLEAPRVPPLQSRPGGGRPAATWACAAHLPFKWERAPILCNAVPYRSTF